MTKTLENTTPIPKPVVSNPFQQAKPFRRPSAIPAPDLAKVTIYRITAYFYESLLNPESYSITDLH